eukprot:763798-Hanusia_phi.AAC.1
MQGKRVLDRISGYKQHLDEFAFQPSSPDPVATAFQPLQTSEPRPSVSPAESYQAPGAKSPLLVAEGATLEVTAELVYAERPSLALSLQPGSLFKDAPPPSSPPSPHVPKNPISSQAYSSGSSQAYKSGSSLAYSPGSSQAYKSGSSLAYSSG